MSDPWKRKEVIGDCTLYLGDCIRVLPHIGRFDAAVTDPPYGIGAAKGAHSNLKMADKNWDESPIGKNHIDAIFSSSDHQIIWGGNYFDLPPCRGFLIWDKSPMPPSYAFGEMAWSSLPINAAKWSGKVGYETPVKYRSHPTQKPVSLMDWCISLLPSRLSIVDPFMGSGTTLVACARLGIRSAGIELDEEYFNIACERVREAYRQADIFSSALKPPDQVGMDF